VSSWQAVAVLVDPIRRALFDHVRRQEHAIGREEAADAIGVSRHLAAFHLDKLVEAGLLASRYEAPADRPRGRGRTPKVYEAVAEIDLTLPPRRYELLASVLAAAVASAPDDVHGATLVQARARGVAFGRSLASLPVMQALDRLGFEPAPTDDGQIVFDNCPFHDVAIAHPELVCGLNLAFVQGLLHGLGREETPQARLAPRVGHCCVEISRIS
jgi:predicted ArsR family transcriptional regulator